jgi:hypothetical protein
MSCEGQNKLQEVSEIDRGPTRVDFCVRYSSTFMGDRKSGGMIGGSLVLQASHGRPCHRHPSCGHDRPLCSSQSQRAPRHWGQLASCVDAVIWMFSLITPARPHVGRLERTMGIDRIAEPTLEVAGRDSLDFAVFQRCPQPPQLKNTRVRTSRRSTTYVERQRGQAEGMGQYIEGRLRSTGFEHEMRRCGDLHAFQTNCRVF